MESVVSARLSVLGFHVNETPYSYIDICRKWYENELIDDFHRRVTIQGDSYEIDRMNFAKRGCADDANLCEVISINVGSQEQSDAVNRILEKNRFDVMYRKQLERMSATGTVAVYVSLKNAVYLDNGKVTGGEIRLTYCLPENYIPLTVENEEVLEAAFTGIDYVKGKKLITLVTFTLNEIAGTKRYIANTCIFNDAGKEVANYWIQLDEVKPFAVMRVAEVNNIRNMDGFGLPKLWNVIPTLKKLDLSMMILNGDLDKGEKLMLTNEVLAQIDPETGAIKKKNPLLKKLFVFLGEKLPDAKSLIQEYNPEIRIDEITKTLELCLSLFSMNFGFGSRKYTFENGRIQTATQYIGERQDGMQELNKQRKEAVDYISGIVRAVLWFSNAFHGTGYDLDAEICLDFDDSYIEDKASKLETMRSDALSFSEIPEFTVRYIMERLNVDREEAMKICQSRRTEEDMDEE